MKARFLADFGAYLRSLPEEARDRESGHLRGFKDHFELRRQTGGLLPSFDFIVMPFDLPDVIMDHPHIKRMTLRTGDLVIIANAKLPADNSLSQLMIYIYRMSIRGMLNNRKEKLVWHTISSMLSCGR
jgi:hypothetical protein